MPTDSEFAASLDSIVETYRQETAGPREMLALLQWQIAQAHRLDLRTTMPGQ